MADWLRKVARELWSERHGQDLIEYTLLISFLALGVVGIALGLGVNTSNLWGTANTTLATASQTTSGSAAAAPSSGGDGGGGGGGSHDHDGH